MPLSAGRPPFPAKTREDAEEFFLSGLQRWRETMQVDKMILVGHSLGGYLAASYALQYPQHVQHLVLVCPAGVVSPVPPGLLLLMKTDVTLFTEQKSWRLVLCSDMMPGMSKHLSVVAAA